MRRLVIEMPVHQFKMKGLEKTLETVKSYTLLHRLKEYQDKYVAICRVEFNGKDCDPVDLVGKIGIMEIEPIYRENDNVHVIQVTGKRASLLADTFRFLGVYQVGTFEIQDEKLKLCFVGKAAQISKFLSNMERQEIAFKVLSLVEMKVSPVSPLSKLTNKQRKILLSAYNLGYYDIPRRTDSRELAKKLNLARSTMAEHLRKAELRLISEAIAK